MTMGTQSGRPSHRGRAGVIAAGLGLALVLVSAGCGSTAKTPATTTTALVTTGTPLPGATPEALAELQAAAIKTRAVQSLTATRPNFPPLAVCPTCTSYTEQYNTPDRFETTAVDPSGVKLVVVQVGSGVWLSVAGGPLKFQADATKSAEEERRQLFALVEAIDNAVAASKVGDQFQWSDATGAVLPVTVQDGYVTIVQGASGPASTVSYRDFNNTPPIQMPH